MKTEFEAPTITVSLFAVEDVITTSGAQPTEAPDPGYPM